MAAGWLAGLDLCQDRGVQRSWAEPGGLAKRLAGEAPGGPVATAKPQVKSQMISTDIARWPNLTLRTGWRRGRLAKDGSWLKDGLAKKGGGWRKRRLAKSGLAGIDRVLAWLAVWRAPAEPGLAGVACCLLPDDLAGCCSVIWIGILS